LAESLIPAPPEDEPPWSLPEFVAGAWPVLEPGRPYLHNWHIDLISEALTAISNGEIQNLIINIPPRFMKSLLVAVLWPAWEWTIRPSLRIMAASYSGDFATRDTMKMRRLVTSAWYRERWGNTVRLAGDQNAKTRFENTATGLRMALGVGSGATGEGGERMIVDDPLKAQDARSVAARERVIHWWRSAMSTRANDPLSMSKVVIMQRLHDGDLCGFIEDEMEDGGEYYDRLVIPMRYEPARIFMMDGRFADPRAPGGPREDEELLWPSRFPLPIVERLERNLGDDAPGQLQQRPVPPGGAMIRMEWWQDKNRFLVPYADHADPVIGTYISIDSGFKEKSTSDPTACVLLEVLASYRVLITPLWNSRLPLLKLVDAIVETARFYRHRHLGEIVIEDKASGTSAIQTLQATAPRWLSDRIVAFNPVGDKIYRVNQAANWMGRDMILLPYPDAQVRHLREMERQFENFPLVEHDDLVDAVVQGIIYLENYIALGYQARILRLARHREVA